MLASGLKVGFLATKPALANALTEDQAQVFGVVSVTSENTFE